MNTRTLKSSLLMAITAAALLAAGCGKKTAPAAGPSEPAAEPESEPALTMHQPADSPAAVARFVETDWRNRPLFAPGSAGALREEQFQALPESERRVKSQEVMAQIEAVKQLARAVVRAGREAAARGDTAGARKHFTAVKDCGAALDNPERLQVVRLTGRALKKLAEAELAGLGQ